VIGLETLTFLSQKEYAEQLDVPNPGPMSDFRRIYKADFDVVYWHERRPEHSHPLPDCCRRQANDGSGEWALRAVKPSRIVPS
jgi:hypothetical protein